MTKDVFNYEKTMTAMIIRWISSLSFLDDDEKAFLLEFSYTFIQHREELFKLYDAIVNKREIIGNKNLITYRINDDKCEVGFNDKMLKLSEEALKEILRCIIDFSEEIVPLGSIVTLKKDVFDRFIEEEIYFVITHRFIVNEGSNTYFTYGGVLYPEGECDEGKVLHFNSSSIREVIFRGFSNEKEDAFIAGMKNELILKNGMHSINFATEEEKKRFE